MEPKNRIFVAGHRGLVGSAIVRALRAGGFSNLVLKTREELDLRDQSATEAFFKSNGVEYVFVAAATVGGIQANSTRQAEFLYDNLMIAANVIHSAARSDLKKLLFLGSSCIYPRLAEQPISSDSLMTGPLEPTNEGYAIAKIAGVKLCEMYRRQYGKNFISVIPTGLYGPGDNFNPADSHVLPALLRKFHEAKTRGDASVGVWGTGSAIREMLFVDDLAEALLLLMEKYEEAKPINVGGSSEHSIRDYVLMVQKIVGYTGDVIFDFNKPDGMPRKSLRGEHIEALGWKPKTSIEAGLRTTYRWALENSVFDAPAGAR